MGLYEVPLSVLGFGIGTSMCEVFVKSRFKHTCEECKSKSICGLGA